MNPVDWALTRDLSAPKKLLLVALAWVADDTGVTIKGQKTIAARLAKDPRWIRQHLPELAAEGLISRYRRHRMNGSRTSDLLVLNMPRDYELDLSIYDGVLGDLEPGDRDPSGGNSPQGLAADSGRPSGGNPPGHTNQPGREPVPNAAGARALADEIPDDFPDELRPHARAAMRVLVDVAKARGAKAISARALGTLIMARPRKPIVRAAHDCAAWIYDHPSASCRDVLARYRRWLDNEEDLAGLERLPGEGPPPVGENVTPLRRGASEADRRRARQQDRARRMADEPPPAAGEIGPGS